jgi:hypothetical protein
VPACGSARPADEATSASRKPNGPAAELDAVKRRAPALAGQDRKGAGQGAGGDDVAGCERRIDRIAREQADEMALNAEYAKIWPNITVKKAPPPDSKEWEGKPDKLQYFLPNPGAGD